MANDKLKIFYDAYTIQVLFVIYNIKCQKYIYYNIDRVILAKILTMCI